jgi:hypothetical protein
MSIATCSDRKPGGFLVQYSIETAKSKSVYHFSCNKQTNNTSIASIYHIVVEGHHYGFEIRVVGVFLDTMDRWIRRLRYQCGT